MRSHLLGMLEPAAILEVNRHAGRAPGVALYLNRGLRSQGIHDLNEVLSTNRSEWRCF
jgi:hypothetical protein